MLNSAVMSPDQEQSLIVMLRYLLNRTVTLDVHICALTKLLRERGVSAKELDAAEAWAEDLAKPARESIRALLPEGVSEDLQDILKRFSGRIQ